MSTDPTLPDVRLPLRRYVSELVARLADADPDAVARMRHVVGERRARIGLDDEAVEVQFVGDRLAVEAAATDRPVDGEGTTDRATVLDLLDAYAEVSDVILDGRLHVRGTTDAVMRIFTAIEIVLDAAPRTPALQALAAHFRRHSPRPRRAEPAPRAPFRHTAWFPAERPAMEDALLARLDLLPDRSRTNTA